MCGTKPTTGKLVLAWGARLWGSSHPCGDGVNSAQTPVLQGKLKLHSCCCEEQQQWHGADHCWPLRGSDGVCAVSRVRVSTLPFLTGTQELLQLGLCPILCQCFWGEDQKSPSSHFAVPQSKWQQGMRSWDDRVFQFQRLLGLSSCAGGDEWPLTVGENGLVEPLQTWEERGHAGCSFWGQNKSFTWPVSVQFDGPFYN